MCDCVEAVPISPPIILLELVWGGGLLTFREKYVF